MINKLKDVIQYSIKQGLALREVIGVIVLNGNLIQQRIVDECNKSLLWSLMADETTDVSKMEQVSMCVRYVCVNGEDLEVCEVCQCHQQVLKLLHQ